MQDTVRLPGNPHHNYSTLALTLLLLTCLAWLPLCAQGTLSDPVERFNYVLGTQTIGTKYHFTQEHPLLETAGVIRDMGSNVLKFALTKSWQRGADSPQEIRPLLELARDEPSPRKALDMPFVHVLL